MYKYNIIFIYFIYTYALYSVYKRTRLEQSIHDCITIYEVYMFNRNYTELNEFCRANDHYVTNNKIFYIIVVTNYNNHYIIVIY